MMLFHFLDRQSLAISWPQSVIDSWQTLVASKQPFSQLLSFFMFFLSKRGQGMARCDGFHWCYWCSSATDCYWLTAGSYLRPSFSAHFRSALRPHLGDLMPLARAPAYPSYQLVSTYLYSFLFNIFQWWITVDSSLMDAVWCLPWPLVRVMI